MARGKRELIDTGTDKRYVKRNQDGTFKESVDVGKSQAADRRSNGWTYLSHWKHNNLRAW